MEVIRKKLTPDEISNPNLRYNPDCDCVQQTSDGGATWFNQPGQDPRTSPALLIPPVSSAQPNCDTAASIVANFRDGLTATLLSLSQGANAVGAASVLLTLLEFLSGIGILIQLIIDFCSVIVSIGVTGVEAAFTDGVYDELTCIIMCDVGTDGSVSASQFAQIQSDVAIHFGALSDVNLVFQGWLAQLGNVGLQNVAALKHISGDCDSCDCAICFVPSADTVAQEPCTSTVNFLHYDSGGAYTVLFPPNGQGLVCDLEHFMSAGDVGWKVTTSWTGGTPAVYQCVESVNPVPAGSPCSTGNQPMTITSGLQQNVPFDHPVIVVQWVGDGGTFHVSEICIEKDN